MDAAIEQVLRPEGAVTAVKSHRGHAHLPLGGQLRYLTIRRCLPSLPRAGLAIAGNVTEALLYHGCRNIRLGEAVQAL